MGCAQVSAQRAPAPAPPINLTKLHTLAARHARLQDDYRAAAERLRVAVHAAGRLRAEAATDPANEAAAALLSKRAPDLAALSPDELEAARIDVHTVRRLIEADRHVTRLTIEANALADDLRPASQLIYRLTAHARRVYPEGML
jgi:hypothetical protein